MFTCEREGERAKDVEKDMVSILNVAWITIQFAQRDPVKQNHLSKNNIGNGEGGRVQVYEENDCNFLYF